MCYTLVVYFLYSFIFVTAYVFCRVGGGRVLDPIPADIGWGQSSPWTSHLYIAGLTYRDKQPFTLTFTPTDYSESPVNKHTFRLWEEAWKPGENPCRHGENMQTPHKKVLPQGMGLNTGPSYCEATVLHRAAMFSFGWLIWVELEFVFL